MLGGFKNQPAYAGLRRLAQKKIKSFEFPELQTIPGGSPSFTSLGQEENTGIGTQYGFSSPVEKTSGLHSPFPHTVGRSDEQTRLSLIFDTSCSFDSSSLEFFTGGKQDKATIVKLKDKDRHRTVDCFMHIQVALLFRDAFG